MHHEIMASAIIDLLCSPMKLERDRGVNELQKFLPLADAVTVNEIGNIFLRLLENENNPWETRNGAFMGVKLLLPYMKQQESYQDFSESVRLLALQYLTDTEVRIRLAAGEILGKLCECNGISIYCDSKDVVLELIHNNLERDTADDTTLSQMHQAEKEKLLEKFSNTTPEMRTADAEQIFHDTAGWKALETSMKALQCMIDGCGSQFEPWITEELLELIFQTLLHSNRFVREMGFNVCSSLVSCSQSLFSENNAVFSYGHQFSRSLGIGLSDNWSQVRLAAAVATRKFLLSLPEDARTTFYQELLPKLCLNRYYLAEGVRIYSQETWRQITGTEGRELVQKYIGDVVKYYMSQAEADNHAVREAACSCIAELAIKINHEVVRPYVPQLLNTLIVCFQDDSWPVRDAACLACGNFVLSFPKESKGSMQDLYRLFFANLEDSIPSVRQGAAGSLINLAKAYGDEALQIILEKIKTGLQNIEKQTTESLKYVNLEDKPATFGVIKRLRDNDPALHTDQTMYSCGSLAPKMSRGSFSGCLRSFRRPSQPWELTDGCFYAVSELACLPSITPHLPVLMELMSRACTFRHYTHHVVLLETLCKQLPVIASSIGKKEFKNYLEMFLEPIFYSLNSENALTSSAASQCLNQLGTIIGPRILRSRIEQFNPRYMDAFDANVHIAPF